MTSPEIEQIEESKKYAYVYNWLQSHKDKIISSSDLSLDNIETYLDYENPYWLNMEKAFQNLQTLQLDSPEGKQQIFEMLKNIVCLLDIVVVNFGALPYPGVTSGDGLDSIKESQRNTLGSGFDYVIEWLRGEQRYQLQKYGTNFSDNAIKSPFDENNDLWKEMKMRYHRAGILGMDIPNGRQSLAKCASLTVAIAAATVRNYGEL